MSFKQRIHFRKGERWGVEKGEVGRVKHWLGLFEDLLSQVCWYKKVSESHNFCSSYAALLFWDWAKPLIKYFEYYKTNPSELKKKQHIRIPHIAIYCMILFTWHSGKDKKKRGLAIARHWRCGCKLTTKGSKESLGIIELSYKGIYLLKARTIH